MVSPYAIANIRNDVNEQSFMTEHFPPVRPALPPPSVSEGPPAKTEIPKSEPTTPGTFLFYMKPFTIQSFKSNPLHQAHQLHHQTFVQLHHPHRHQVLRHGPNRQADVVLTI